MNMNASLFSVTAFCQQYEVLARQVESCFIVSRQIHPCSFSDSATGRHATAAAAAATAVAPNDSEQRWRRPSTSSSPSRGAAADAKASPLESAARATTAYESAALRARATTA